MVLLKMRGVKQFTLFLFIFCSAIFSIYSIESGTEMSLSVGSAYYFPDNKGYNLNGDLAPITYSPIPASDTTERDLGSTWGGAELQGTYKFTYTMPFMTGGSSLTKDNSLKVSPKFSLSPVNFDIGIETTFTPIAFLDFTIGSTISSGWQAIGIVGLGLNNDPSSKPKSDSFQGILSQTWLSGTFKFDTAAILSGDTTWKHLIILTSHKITSKYFTAAGSNDPWTFQGSEGDKFNGFLYSSTSVVAYQMPLILEMAGVLVDTETNLFDNSSRSTMSSGGWGSDFVQVRFGGLLNFKFNDKHSLAILPQMINRVRYTDSTVKEGYFANRKVNTNSPIFFDFDRIAFSYTYKF